MNTTKTEKKLLSAAENAVGAEVFDAVLRECSAVPPLTAERKARENATEPSTLEANPGKRTRRRLLSFALAAAAALALTAGVLVYFMAAASPEVVATVSVEVNPRVELSLDSRGVVISARSATSDGEALLEGLKLKGRECADAVAELVRALAGSGALTQEKNAVLITTEGGLDGIQDVLCDAALRGYPQASVLSQRLLSGGDASELASRYGVSRGKAALASQLAALYPETDMGYFMSRTVHELGLIAAIGKIEFDNTVCTGELSTGALIGADRAESIVFEEVGVNAYEVDKYVNYGGAYEAIKGGGVIYVVSYGDSSAYAYPPSADWEWRWFYYEVDAFTGSILTAQTILKGLPEQYLSSGEAAAAALSAAGVRRETCEGLTAVPAYAEDDTLVYLVSFVVGKIQYQAEIDALAGEVRSLTQGPAAQQSSPMAESAVRRELGKMSGALTANDLAKITQLVLDGRTAPDNSYIDAELLYDMPNLTSLALAYLDAVDLSAFSGLTRLTELTLRELPISDLGALAGLSGLKGLQIFVRGGTALDIGAIKNLAGLETLTLAGAQGTVQGLDALSSLTQLRYLSLNSCDTDGVGFVAGLEKLETLHIDLSRVGTLAAFTAARLPALRTLSLDRIYGARSYDLSPLAGLKGLTALDLYGVPFDSLAPLAGLTALRTLRFRHDDTDDVSPLASLVNLETLRGGSLRSVDLAPLGALAGLREFEWEGSPVSEPPAGSLLNADALSKCASLNRVSICGARVDLSEISALRSVEHLRLDSAGLIDISPIAAMTKLRFIMLNANAITDATPLYGFDSLVYVQLCLNPLTDAQAAEIRRNIRAEFFSFSRTEIEEPIY